MVFGNILEAVGRTPLIRLNKVVDDTCAEVLVKFEATNVGGSIKTRTALRMIRAAEEAGQLHPDSIICEPTSGNQGIGLALVAATLGYAAKIIMPDSVSVERRKLVAHYGADVLLEHDDGDIGACVARCIERAEAMAKENPRIFVPQQFENPENLVAQREGTAAEIVEDLGRRVDGFCSGVGTGGTITGIGHVLKDLNPACLVWAAEPENAAILSGGSIGTHLQMGIGDGIIPDILDTSVIDAIEIVSDTEALEMSRRLAREEGMCVGISSGTNVVVALRLARLLGPGHTVVTVAPDTGERYLTTKLFCGEDGRSAL